MKSIEDLTEQEILKLSNDDINDIIRLKKASEGIKLIKKPELPILKDIDSKDSMIYMCGLFSSKIVFTNIDELSELLEKIYNSKNKFRLNSNYISDANYLIEDLEKEYTFNSWDEIRSLNVYSPSLYNKVKKVLEYNKQMKSNYDTLLKEYEKEKGDSEWIENGIWDNVNEVREKYYRLNEYCYKMKNDYMSLAGNDEKIAIGFLKKAYLFNAEEEKYILDNYKTIE